ncbi:MAG TPA: hypothetical protein VJZ77_05430 [Blastocatellia bacterium]|nr:hypothetical protein [Blastocatellia bacterium]
MIFISNHLICPLAARASPGIAVDTPLETLNDAGSVLQSLISSQNRTSTDEDGNFKFTSLESLVYSVSASSAKGYAPSPAPVTASRRVVVKGVDAGGIELKFLPMASITGKFAIEATPGVCESKRKWLLEEALLAVRQPMREATARFY